MLLNIAMLVSGSYLLDLMETKICINLDSLWRNITIEYLVKK